MSTIESITPVSNTAPIAPGAPVENPGALLDRDAFLKLLVAQLKYQDPTKPADASQMVAQSAQLTMVDRLNDIAESLKTTASSDKLALAGTLVGRDVAFVSEDGFNVTARVESVKLDDGELTLFAGGYVVPVGAVTQVLAPVLATPTTALA